MKVTICKFLLNYKICTNRQFLEENGKPRKRVKCPYLNKMTECPYKNHKGLSLKSLKKHLNSS